jgi:hypothetical protein
MQASKHMCIHTFTVSVVRSGRFRGLRVDAGAFRRTSATGLPWIIRDRTRHFSVRSWYLLFTADRARILFYGISVPTSLRRCLQISPTSLRGGRKRSVQLFERAGSMLRCSALCTGAAASGSCLYWPAPKRYGHWARFPCIFSRSGNRR